MQSYIREWKLRGIWPLIEKEKYVEEAKITRESQSGMRKYYKANNANGKGAILFAVLRGKMSEGLDFADAQGRAVIITGVPFAPVMDTRVVLKRNYLDSSDMSTMSGCDWYVLDAVRAVNQAIGRVIRHKNDYAAILLCDKRFNERNIQEKMSNWVREILNPFDQGFDSTIKNLAEFYKQAEENV